jgi:hypothetical protein
MAEKELAIKRLQQRHDTAQNWKVKNPVLAEGEIGVETDTGNIKAGNGATTWNSLPYSNAGLGGGSGGGDDGYFPANAMELIMEDYVVAEDGMAYLKVYDPSISEFPPPKYIAAMAMEDANVFVVVAVATKEELLQWDGAVGGDIAGINAVLNTVSMMGITAQTGTFPVPKADNKPLWVGYTNGLTVMPTYGFY